MTSQVNSEFYTGWLDHWGDQHAAVDSRKVSRVLDQMLVMGANVNMYVSSNTSSSSSHTFIFTKFFHKIEARLSHNAMFSLSTDMNLLRVFLKICDLVFLQSNKYTLTSFF